MVGAREASEHRTGPQMSMSSARRWAALGAYGAAIYASLPFARRLGLRFLRTAPGGWFLGPGLALVVVAGRVAVVLALRRRLAPAGACAGGQRHKAVERAASGKFAPPDSVP